MSDKHWYDMSLEKALSLYLSGTIGEGDIIFVNEKDHGVFLLSDFPITVLKLFIKKGYRVLVKTEKPDVFVIDPDALYEVVSIKKAIELYLANESENYHIVDLEDLSIWPLTYFGLDDLLEWDKEKDKYIVVHKWPDQKSITIKADKIVSGKINWDELMKTNTIIADACDEEKKFL